jgi:hypothetical protein
VVLILSVYDAGPCGTHAVAALTHSSVRQADGVKVVLVSLDAGDIHLDLNDAGVDAINRGAESFIKHGPIEGSSE